VRIKVFTAETMQEAMSKVKLELGIDAVILHTRRFQKGGIFGYLGKEMIEVTAAVEEKKAVQSAPVIAPELIVPRAVAKKYAEAGAAPSDGTPAGLTPKTAPLNDAPEKSVETDGTAHKESVPPQKKQRVFKRKVTRKKREEAAPEETAAGEQEQKEIKVQEKDSQIEKLQQELSDMKKMLEQVIAAKAAQQPEKITLRKFLAEHEVEAEIIEEICAGILDEAVLNDKDSPEAEGFLAEYFERTFRPARNIELDAGRTRIAALIGATGVGKTTTIAKIAANFVLEKSASVALITADTYRISAVEQLRTYSDIVGVPLEIVYAPEELGRAIEKHMDKQVILIDTAGRSQHNQYQMEELKQLLSVNEAIEKHLVISATTKYRDAVDILRKFAICEPDKVLFTKVDETNCVGTIVNLAYHYPITLSYLTNGQSVPDDISLGSAKYLAKLLLR